MQNRVTFPSGDGQAELEAVWHLPTSRATNGAVIVLHGRSYNKDSQPSIGLCEGAAALGLTALRFDFRYVQAADPQNFNPATDGLNDLIGAFNFLESFGKEIKPKRYYLLGKSLGGLVALGMAQHADYADKINGVGVLGLVVHSEDGQQRFLPESLPGLRSSLLVVQGDSDPYANPAEVQDFLQTQTQVQTELQTIPRAGHSYEPVPAETGGSQEQNMQQAITHALAWLERQDSIRENLRK